MTEPDDVTPDEPAFGNYFVSAYPPFDHWKEDAVAGVDEVLDRPPSPEARLGLYVHVPFCVKRCRYCYYLSHDDRAALKERYLDAVLQELGLLSTRAAVAGRRPAFVYFGGGTPSSLSAGQIERLLAGLRAQLDWGAVEETTFECAPQTVNAEKVRVLREAGVNRISLGVQQLDDHVLAANGRVHLVSDVLRAYELLRDANFDVVNLDLMVGMVDETEETFGQGLEQVVALAPESITIYQLEIPFNTPLYRHLRDEPDAARPVPWTVKHERLARAFARLADAGYTQRSAYTAVRDPARHHFVYQDELYHGADLLGLGVSAFSYMGGTHFQNLARIEPYMERVAAGEQPLSRAYPLSDRERLVRELVLQLKLLRVELEPLRAKFGVDPLAVFEEPLGRYADAGWLEISDAEISLTAVGVPRVDRLLSGFYLPEHRSRTPRRSPTTA